MMPTKIFNIDSMEMNQFFSFVLKYITVISLKKWDCALKIN